MSTVDIDGNSYPVYADVDYADQYLAGDAQRALTWAATEELDKKRALVSATRLLQRLDWINGPPPTEAPSAAVADATSLLAADIALKPTLGDSAASGSNVKAVGAGSAKVEFFAPVAGSVLPSAAFALLRGLLGPAGGTIGVGLDATAYGSEDWRQSRFDPTDYVVRGEGFEERLW